MLQVFITSAKDDLQVLISSEKIKSLASIKETKDDARVEKTFKKGDFSLGVDKKSNPLYFFIRNAKAHSIFNGVGEGISIKKIEEIIDFVNFKLTEMGTKIKYSFKMEDKFTVSYTIVE